MTRKWNGDEITILEEDIIVGLAKKYNKTPAQVISIQIELKISEKIKNFELIWYFKILIRFALDRGIHVIPKSVTPSRIESNSQVFDFKLTSDEIQQIKERVPIKESDTFNDSIEINRPIKIRLFMKFHLGDF